MCAEWKLYVEPELRRLFQSATETVAADLQQLNGSTKPFAELHAADSDEKLGCLAERAKSGAPCHRGEI